MAMSDEKDKAAAVGNKVREIRKRARLTMRELADVVGVSLLTIQRIETGKLSPSVVLLSEIAYHLRYPLTAFIGGEEHVVLLKASEKNIIESGRLSLKVMAHGDRYEMICLLPSGKEMWVKLLGNTRTRVMN